MKRSPIVRFYEGQPNPDGVTFEDMIQQSQMDFESCHGFFQWLFPLTEASDFNLNAPILTETDIKYINDSPKIQERMKRAMVRFRYQLGFATGWGPDQWEDQGIINMWCMTNNHNFLRITRAIRSARTFGLMEEARNLYNDATIQACRKNAPGETLLYWWRAMFEPIERPLK